MNRDIFRRPMRMTHKFGETERINDPLGVNTFEFKGPMPSSARRSAPVTVQQQGQHDVFNPPRSPVQTPGGRITSVNGPAPDMAEAIGAPMPVSTKKRVNHLKTDK
jgi:hypothetical protein